MLKEIPENDVPEKMTVEKVIYELKTMNLTGASKCESNAVKEAVKIISKCEKYRKALSLIRTQIVREPSDMTDLTGNEMEILKAIEHAFDCEES